MKPPRQRFPNHGPKWLLVIPISTGAASADRNGRASPLSV